MQVEMEKKKKKGGGGGGGNGEKKRKKKRRKKKMSKLWEVFPFAGVAWLFYRSTVLRQKYCFARNSSSSWCSHFSLLLSNEQQQNVGSYSCHTCRPCS